MSATVSRSTSSASVKLFLRRNATASYRTPLVCVLKTASSSSETGVRLCQDSFSPPPPPALLSKPALIDDVPEPVEHVSDIDWSVWEDRILEETVPLVGFVRTIIHSGKYKIGERLKPEHQSVILERLLPYHPQCDEKIGCGVEAISVGFHTEFKGTKCLFITRTDGERIDFSYWKCIKGLIREKYPSQADAFIFRHFRRRKFNPINEK